MQIYSPIFFVQLRSMNNNYDYSNKLLLKKLFESRACNAESSETVHCSLI